MNAQERVETLQSRLPDLKQCGYLRISRRNSTCAPKLIYKSCYQSRKAAGIRRACHHRAVFGGGDVYQSETGIRYLINGRIYWQERVLTTRLYWHKTMPARRTALRFFVSPETTVVCGVNAPCSKCSQHLAPPGVFEKTRSGAWKTCARLSRNLRQAATVIIFPRGSGTRSRFGAGYAGVLKSWSESVGVFLSKVPEARLLPLLISQTVAPRVWNSLLVAWAKTPKKRRQIALIMQFAMQRLRPDKDWKIPIRVQVGESYDPRALSNTLDPREINHSVRQVMSELLLSAYPASA